MALRTRAPAAAGAAGAPGAPAHPRRYSETDVQVLGFVLERAVGMPVSDYLASRPWQPLGMESRALWALDREGGSEKTFCCLSARARDFARLGKLVRDGGRWNARQIVSAAWAARSVPPGMPALDGYVHQHLWWTPQGSHDGTPDVGFTWDSLVTGTTRSYHGIDAFSAEAGMARIHGGMHFGHATAAGEELGRRVARWVAERHFGRR